MHIHSICITLERGRRALVMASAIMLAVADQVGRVELRGELRRDAQRDGHEPDASHKADNTLKHKAQLPTSSLFVPTLPQPTLLACSLDVQVEVVCC